MAYAANSAFVAWPLGILAAIKRAFESVFLAMSVASSYDARLKDIERLQRMSDNQLAEMDLKREDIVRYVYRDLYYV